MRPTSPETLEDELGWGLRESVEAQNADRIEMLKLLGESSRIRNSNLKFAMP
jgi:hypothetical protein